MIKITRVAFLLGVLFLVGTVSAYADTFDFRNMADSTVVGVGLGESAWSPLVLNGTGYTVTITATKNAVAAYAYLDAGSAGLGVCGAVTGGANVSHLGSTTNLCNPGGDDNIDAATETLKFVFSADVTISTLTFDDNHDADFSLLGNTVLINGVSKTFADGGVHLDSHLGSFTVASGTAFTVAYGGTNPDQSYIGAMTVTKNVPEPASIALLCVGLFGLAVAGKRLQPAYRRNR